MRSPVLWSAFFFLVGWCMAEGQCREVIRWAHEGLPPEIQPPEICILPTPRKLAVLGERVPLGREHEVNCATAIPRSDDPVMAHAGDVLAGRIATLVNADVPIITEPDEVPAEGNGAPAGEY